MKKLITYLLLCLLIIPTCFTLAGCKKQQTNENLYSSYLEISKDYDGLKLTSIKDKYNFEDEAYKVDFDYLKMPALHSQIQTSSSKYHYLESLYHNLLDASLEAFYVYTPKIAGLKLSKNQSKNLTNSLENFKQELYNLVYSLRALNTSLQASTNESISLNYLQHCFAQYEKTISNANELSFNVSNIYYTKCMINTNYSNTSYQQFTQTDLIDLQTNMHSNIYYYKSMYAGAYNQLLKASNFSSLVIANGNLTPPTYNPYFDILDVSLTPKHISIVENNKLAIYNYLNSLYNMQNKINTHYKNFINNINNSKNIGATTEDVEKQQLYQTSVTQFISGSCYDSYEIVYALITKLFIF